MRPTAFGLKAIAFYALVAVAYFASPYTNLFFLLVSFLTVVFLLNLLWTLTNLRGVTGHVDDVAAMPADTVTECEVELDGGAMKRLYIHVELAIGRKDHVLCRAILLDGQVKLTGRMPRLPRGIHEVRACRIASAYPLGLALVTRKIDGPKYLTVYPTPSSEQLLEQGSVIRGDDDPSQALAPSGGDAETAALREYRVGDPIRHVHWKASARNPRSLIVREFEPRGDAAIEVEFDARCDDEDFERSLQAISRLALTAQELDQPLVLYTQGLQESFGSGGRPLLELWKWLAIASRDESDKAPPRATSGAAIALPGALHRLDELGEGASR